MSKCCVKSSETCTDPRQYFKMAALPPESQAPPALVAHYKLQFTKAFYFVVLDTQKPFQPVNGQNPLIFNLT